MYIVHIDKHKLALVYIFTRPSKGIWIQEIHKRLYDFVHNEHGVEAEQMVEKKEFTESFKQKPHRINSRRVPGLVAADWFSITLDEMTTAARWVRKIEAVAWEGAETEDFQTQLEMKRRKLLMTQPAAKLLYKQAMEGPKIKQLVQNSNAASTALLKAVAGKLTKEKINALSWTSLFAKIAANQAMRELDRKYLELCTVPWGTASGTWKINLMPRPLPLGSITRQITYSKKEDNKIEVFSQNRKVGYFQREGRWTWHEDGGTGLALLSLHTGALGLKSLRF